MSSFWTDSTGEDLTENTEKEFNAGGGDFAVIPEKTACLMSIDRAAWKEDKDNNRYVNIQWSVLKPDCYAKRVIFQKIWCGDDDPNAKDAKKKRDKALRMLATIDANAGGKLAKAGREPDDDDLALALTNKQMICRLMTWEMNGSEGNWIQHVAPAKGGTLVVTTDKEAMAAELKTAKPKSGGSSSSFADDLDDDIPF